MTANYDDLSQLWVNYNVCDMDIHCTYIIIIIIYLYIVWAYILLYVIIVFDLLQISVNYAQIVREL